MTSITTYPVKSRGISGPLTSPLQLVATFFGFVPAALRQWRAYRELRTIESLPEGLLKDIGWPSGDNDR